VSYGEEFMAGLGCIWSLLKVREVKYRWKLGSRESALSRESVLLFSR
jgi:hypothetical protein